MAKNIFHASIEGAQHGAKTLEEFLTKALENPEKEQELGVIRYVFPGGQIRRTF